MSGGSQSKRKRISGVLGEGRRGLNISTDAGDLWVIDCDDFDANLIGRQVMAEGVLVGLDRLKVDWIGEAVQ